MKLKPLTQEDVGFIPHTTTAIYVGDDFTEETEGLLMAEDLFMRIDGSYVAIEKVKPGTLIEIGNGKSEIVLAFEFDGKRDIEVDFELIANMTAIEFFQFLSKE